MHVFLVRPILATVYILTARPKNQNCEGTGRAPCSGGQSRSTRGWSEAQIKDITGESPLIAGSKRPGPGTVFVPSFCLLDQQKLRLYEAHRMDLVSYYRAIGFHVEHIPVRNYRPPALSDSELKKVWQAYQRLKKPVQIHCSAG